MKRGIWLSVFVMAIIGLSNVGVSAQEGEIDTLQNHPLEEVVVTATRNERTLGALPMPITLIKKDLIKTMGSVRLNDILTEQTGLVVVPQVNGQGNGIQVQGFDPDYTLILVDGEPIVGRYTGSLELSRLSVGNIKQVELVKGPSSSLYGSDALAGVINIITERPNSNQGNFSARYGANNTLDLSTSGTLVNKNLGVYAFANRYSTDGYDLSPQNDGKTVSPFFNYTLGSRITYKISDRTDVSLGLRYFSEIQDFDFDVLTNGISYKTNGEGKVRDWNINPVVTHRFNSNLKAIGRFYTTQYGTSTILKRAVDDVVTYRDNFDQNFTRYELNGEYFFNEQNILTMGVGNTVESVITSRYNDQLERRQRTYYSFVQHEWMPIKPLTIIGGIRYDQNSSYGEQFSPKLSIRLEIAKGISLKGSFGFGFKAPDFRQLYFNFTNQAGGGYIVLGTEVIKEKFDEYIALGQIQPGTVDISQYTSLQPERSKSFNFGGDIQLSSKLKFTTNIFYNLVSNLIDNRLVATNSLNKNIYSYVNVNRAVMKGVETDISYSLGNKWSLSLGYQLLYALDEDIVDLVSSGKKFWKDPITQETRQLKPSEYFGLYNRSRHSGNFKIFYRDKANGIEGSLRVIYRGKFGIGGLSGNIQGESVSPSERNGNGLLDDYDFFVNGYALVNLSVAKTIKRVRFQAGVDNLFDYTEPIYIPNIPGRLAYLSIGLSINKNN